MAPVEAEAEAVIHPSPDNVDVILNCWSSISWYLNIESLVSVSRSCHSLHKEVITEDTGKIKAISFKVDCEQTTFSAFHEGKINWQSAPARIPRYLPLAINSIHFPCLTVLKVAFPPERTSWNGNGNIHVQNAHLVALPMLAQKIGESASSCTHLEELVLDVNSLVRFEDGRGSMQSSYAVLGENLSRCITRQQGLAIKQQQQHGENTNYTNKDTDKNNTLKRLTIFNQGMLEDGVSSIYSISFLAAMVQVLRAGRDCLEEVTVLLGDAPSCNSLIANNNYPNNNNNAGTDFFAAIFAVRNLKALRIQLQNNGWGPLLNEFVDAASAADRPFPSETLEEISVFVPECAFAEEENRRIPTPSIALFLSLVRGVRTLKQFTFYAPEECWNERGISQLSHVFSCPLLESISIRFGGYQDFSGAILDNLFRLLRRRGGEDLDGMFVAITDMGYVDEDSETYRALMQGYTSPHDGESCMREDDFGYNFLMNPLH